MINPANTPVDIQEQREWLLSHKSTKGFSWTTLSSLVGLPYGTLSSFGSGNYGGKNDKIAAEIFKYRQTLEVQAQHTVGLIEGPGFFETPTTLRIKGLLIEAHRGRMTLAAMSPGTSKTETAHEYQNSAANVHLVTMRKSVKTVNALLLLILRGMNVQVKGGWGAQLSDLIIDRLKNRRALLIFDEANHLSVDQFEEIRGLHDESGCGVAFLGNEELKMRISVGKRSDEFARLNSRIAQSHEQRLPLPDDVEAFCDAWMLTDLQMRDLLKRIALTPAAGGLRECAQIVEQASMIAADENRPLSFADLREAKATRATKNIL